MYNPKIDELEKKLAEQGACRQYDSATIGAASILEILLGRRKALYAALADLNAAIKVLEANPNAAEDFEIIRKVY